MAFEAERGPMMSWGASQSALFGGFWFAEGVESQGPDMAYKSSCHRSRSSGLALCRLEPRRRFCRLRRPMVGELLLSSVNGLCGEVMGFQTMGFSDSESLQRVRRASFHVA